MASSLWRAANRERQRQLQREWYARNKKKAQKWIKEQKRAKIEWFKEFKASLKCQKCPENHPACLDFHHRDDQSKDINVAQAMKKGWGKQRILEEIAKCDVLCANCHRKLHYELKTQILGV